MESIAVSLAVNEMTRKNLQAVSDVLGTPGDDFYHCMSKDKRALHFAVRLALHDAPEHKRLVVLVDQFEELFAVTKDEPLRAAAIENLLYASSIVGGKTIILITMRADFYGQCAAYPALASALTAHQELIGPMGREELQRAIEMSARRVGCEFEPGLIELLVHAVCDQPGALPLLEYTLARLWEGREGRKLTTEFYRRIGEVQGALEQRANEVFEQFNSRQRELCRRLFLRLTKPGEGTEDTKRRIARSELGQSDEFDPVILKLADARLVTTRGAPECPETTCIEISHEALISGWSKLRQWVEEDREALIVHHQLIQAVQDWDTREKDSSFLYRGARLTQTEEWAKMHSDEVSPSEREFLSESRREEDTLKWNLAGINESPDGVVLLNSDNQIFASNARFRHMSGCDSVIGENFFVVLGSPEILGPDFCPFHSALCTGTARYSTLRSVDHRYFHVHAAPVRDADEPVNHLVVTVRDVTLEMLQQQKLAALHQAGMELAGLTPDELLQMAVEERIELLKSNILRLAKDLLNFDVVHVRLLDPRTSRLETLLQTGMVSEAEGRVLYAKPQGNGATGFVAATGKSYLCEDTSEDPLYLSGSKDAKSSLTVPIVLHDEVLGTFSVESLEPRAFSESDLQFLEIFTRDVAAALNTLELLVAEKASTAAASVEATHGAVALPLDEILNDAVNVLERYVGHEPEAVDSLRRILRNARDIKQLISHVGQRMAPVDAVPASAHSERHVRLRGCRVLVVDTDEFGRKHAHDLLQRYQFTLETARSRSEAVFMVRHTEPGAEYDVIIADSRLPDMNSKDLLVRLSDLLDPVPLILMASPESDPELDIALAAGLPLKALLDKPLRLDPLLEAIETLVEAKSG